jgi:HAMP domain-containing protein
VIQDIFLILSVAIVCLGLTAVTVRWQLGGGVILKLWSIISVLLLVVGMDTFLVGRLGVTILTISIGTVSGVICIVISILTIMRQVVKPIIEMLNTANQLADGDLDITIPYHSQDEIGQLGIAIEKIASSSRDMALATNRLAGGDLSAQIEPRTVKGTCSARP